MRARLLLPLLFVGLGLSAPAQAQAQDSMSEAKARLQALDQALQESDLELAKRELKALRESVNQKVDTLDYFEGRIAFEEGRYSESVRLLKEAGLEDKSGSYLRLAKETEAVTRGYARSESAHFVFFYPPGKDVVMVPYALETLEHIRSALERDLGYAPPGKVRVEVVNNASELAKVSTLTLEQINTTGTIAICKFNKLMVTSPHAVLSGYDWQDTLAHEYTHLVVTQKGHNSVPIWLQEGLAKYLESSWRGPPGQALSPSQRALLAERVRTNRLVPFAKMHPSMAMLPTWQDASVAFAEVFYAADYVYKEKGPSGLRAIVDGMGQGLSDQKAVEHALGKPFSQFEKAWIDHIRAQPVPKGAIPPSDDKVVLKAEGGDGKDEAKKDKGREISFQDFVEVEEPQPRRFAHLGELMRERQRMTAAADEFGRAHALVGDKYESISNKYALALLSLRRVEEAEQVLLGSLKLHPGSAQSQVHLGRIYLARHDYSKAKAAYLNALAVDPFDPEIHLAFVRVADALKDTALLDRATKASVVLTGLTPAQVLAASKRLAPDSKGDLSEAKVP